MPREKITHITTEKEKSYRYAVSPSGGHDPSDGKWRDATSEHKPGVDRPYQVTSPPPSMNRKHKKIAVKSSLNSSPRGKIISVGHGHPNRGSTGAPLLSGSFLRVSHVVEVPSAILGLDNVGARHASGIPRTAADKRAHENTTTRGVEWAAFGFWCE